MKTLLDPAGLDEALRRIHALRADSPPVWGRMSAAQMLAHCQVPLRVATGETHLRRGLIGLLFGRLAKKKLVGPAPFGKNMPTAPAFRVHDQRDFAIERENLIALLQRFQRGGAEGITKKPHPFFGPLSVPEWEALQWKHVDHHLRQFGV